MTVYDYDVLSTGPVGKGGSLAAYFKEKVRGTKLHDAMETVQLYTQWAVQSLRPVNIPAAPHMDAAEIMIFKELLESSKSFLEYGAGGSTVMAAQSNVAKILSVESDPRFARALNDTFGNAAGQDIEVIYASLGPVGGWGKPLHIKPTEDNIARWKNYAEAPWQKFAETGGVPDLILIDGRFRVNCTLTSLLALPEKSDTVFLFDDYFDQGRDYYRAIEPFITVGARAGGGLVFKKSDTFYAPECQRAQEVYALDWR